MSGKAKGSPQMRSGTRPLAPARGGRMTARQHGIMDSGAAAKTLPVFDALKMAVGGVGDDGQSARTHLTGRPGVPSGGEMPKK